MPDTDAMVDRVAVDKKRLELKAFIKARGLKVKPWAAEAGLSSGTVRNFLAGRSHTMTQATIEALAKAAGATPDEIFPGSYRPQNHKENDRTAHNPQKMVAGETTGRVTIVPGGERRFEGPGDLPILGHVKAGEMGLFIDQGEVQGVTVRIRALEGVNGAYAVRVHDDSMYPAYHADDLVQVNPFLRVKPGDDVVIQLTSGEAFIKLLVRRTEKEVVCRQWNPDKPVSYEAKRVKTIHKIVRPTT